MNISPTIAKFPLINPVRFLRKSGTKDYWKNSQPFFETQREYFHRWQQGDRMRLQFAVNFTKIDHANIYVKLINCKTKVVSGVFAPEYANIDSPFLYITAGLILPAVTGDYFIEIYLPYYANLEPEYFYSEPINIKATQQGTVLFRYSDTGINHDMFFINQLSQQQYFYFRCPGGWQSKDFTPAAVNNIFIDQSHSFELLSAIPFGTKKLTIGDNNGVPNFVADQVNRIFCCDAVYIDDEKFSKTENSTFEQTEYGDKENIGVWKIELAASPNEESDNFTKKFGLIIDPVINFNHTHPLQGVLTFLIDEIITAPIHVVIIGANLPQTIVTGITVENYICNVNTGELPNGNYSLYYIY